MMSGATLRLGAAICLVAIACLPVQAPGAYEQRAETHESPYSLTPAERDLLERVIMAEARGEGYEGQVAVAQVVWDRLWHPAFPGTVKEILAKEFARPYKGQVFKSVKEAVSAVFDAGARAIEDAVHYFMNPRTASSTGAAWIRRNGTLVAVIGRHEFYKDR